MIVEMLFLRVVIVVEITLVMKLDRFRDWFLSPDGGSKGKRQTQQHVYQVQKVIHAVCSVEHLF